MHPSDTPTEEHPHLTGITDAGPFPEHPGDIDELGESSLERPDDALDIAVDLGDWMLEDALQGMYFFG